MNQPLYLVPKFFQNKPMQRLVAPGIDAEHLNDDALGRALDTLYTSEVTELYSLIATTAAERLGLAPRFMHLEAPVSMSMGAITARKTLTSTSSISPAATAVIIGLISTR